MRKTKDNKLFNNIGYSTIAKFLAILLNFLIPRIFIISFGSEVNGLLSTITQIFSYLALLEAGIGSASVNALYKPLDQKDHGLINQVMGESITYYRKVTRYYALGVLSFALLYPVLCGGALDRKMIFQIILLQGVGNCISYYFSASYIQLLIADGKNYFVEVISCIISVGTALTKIILVSLGFNVVAVQFGYLLIVLCKIPIVFFLCCRKYPWLNPVRTRQYDSIKDRGAFVVHEISSTIFSNTDIFIISSVCGFALSSVYSIYSLVFGSLSTIINTANAGLGFVLGQNYYKDHDRFLKIYDCYSTVYTTAVFAVMTVAYLLIIPFVRLYTTNVVDINYIIPGLPILFAVINIMSGSRAVSARLITVTGHARNTQNRSILETAINLISSIILVHYFGIHGVLIGTVIALAYRMNDIILYSNRVILKRNPWREYKGILANTAVFLLAALLGPEMIPSVDNFIAFIGLGITATFCVSAVYFLVTILTHIHSIRGWVALLRTK